MINLDPACLEVPYPANIDIRDTVKYKEVMKSYSLGPNGAIITSLNLFSTRFDQVMNIIDKRKEEFEYVIFDTPGQIEVFTWSASGTIITDTLGSSYPTVIVYVMDIVKSNNPITFMSNMLYACSILYKTKLPFLIAFNKIDVVDHSFAKTWMTDFEAFDAAIDSETSYMANLTRSLSLVLDSFYENISTVGVSAATGIGMKEFFEKVDELKVEYYKDYKPEYERIQKESKKKQEEREKERLEEIASGSSKTKKKPKIEEELITFGSKSFDPDLMTVEDDDSNEEEEEEGMYLTNFITVHPFKWLFFIFADPEEKIEYEKFRKMFIDDKDQVDKEMECKENNCQSELPSVSGVKLKE